MIMYIDMYIWYVGMNIHKIKNLNFSSLKFASSCHSFWLRIAIAKRLLNTTWVLFVLGLYNYVYEFESNNWSSQ